MPFTPDRFFTRVTQIDIERDIVSRGVKCVLIDLEHASAARYPPGPRRHSRMAQGAFCRGRSRVHSHQQLAPWRA